MWVSFLSIVLTIIEGAFSLRLVELTVPETVVSGNSMWLNCTFDLERDELYSIKWYKNNVEFYRHLPTDYPPAQKYDLPGIYIDLHRSNLGHLYLYRSDVKTEGTYRCEVSAEAPSFQTVREEKELRIYVLPEEGPKIAGTRTYYQVGDLVNVSCSAGPSKPAAILRWYINGEQAPPENEIRYSPTPISDGTFQTNLGLRFVAQRADFRRGNMKLRCQAVISQSYTMSSEEVIVSNNIKASGYHSGPVGDGPIITGGQLRYQVGDTVDVNCTAAKSRPAAELKWFINDKEAYEQFLLRYPTVTYPEGDETAVLGLQFTVQHHHFQKDEIRLKCTATLSRVINMSSEEKVVGSRQQSSGLHVLEETQAVLNSGKRSPESSWTIICKPFLILLLQSVGYLL